LLMDEAPTVSFGVGGASFCRRWIPPCGKSQEPLPVSLVAHPVARRRIVVAS